MLIPLPQFILNAPNSLPTNYHQVSEEQMIEDFSYYEVLPSGMKFEDNVTIEKDPYAAATGAHAIAVLTEWDVSLSLILFVVFVFIIAVANTSIRHH